MPGSLTSCRSCGSTDLREVISLGLMPLVNHFISESEVDAEKKYPLDLVFCATCTLTQLSTVVPGEILYRNYMHMSSAAESNIRHLKTVSNLIQNRWVRNQRNRILEIGSNDGTLLSFLRESCDVLVGVDPAVNLRAISKNQSADIVTEFFSADIAETIANDYGTFDVVIGLNVAAHGDNLNGFLRGVHTTLAPNGTVILEVAYVLETILDGGFDTIYHEHVYSFSLHSISAAFERAGLTVVDVEKVDTQGGSLRVFGQRTQDDPKPLQSVKQVLDTEANRGLINAAVYETVPIKAQKFKEKLRSLVRDLKLEHGRMVGLGAPARGVVILNYCGIGRDDLAYIIDDTPLKQGKLLPGMHIPIRDWDHLNVDSSTAFLMLSWNYAREITQKLHAHVDSGTTIIPFPEMTTVSHGR